jgi:hypothetical protein
MQSQIAMRIQEIRRYPAKSMAGEQLQRASRERLRHRYRPADLRLLFIGEAPPASGRFFYHGDSGLYRAMREAFQIIDPAITDDNFLAAFQSYGCYLIDLCPTPVDRLDLQSRRAACLASEPSLARTIARLQPPVIATLVRSIRSNVACAAARANWTGALIDLPYPGRWLRHKEIFLETLVPQLRSLYWKNHDQHVP